jgi:thiamine-phosphate pyrophosphorylase
MKDFGLYIIITKPVLRYSTIAEICVKHKIKMLQLREKHLTDKEIVSIGREIKSITKGSDTNFVINDRPDIAILCDADYLHLGQNDLCYEDARRITGNNIKIGLSTHSIQQAKDALVNKPDYIGFGPVYKTPTKAIPDAVVGTERLTEVLKFSDVPVVAIGGIFPENIHEVLKTGARNIALVRYFMETEDFEKRIINIQSYLNK